MLVRTFISLLLLFPATVVSSSFCSTIPTSARLDSCTNCVINDCVLECETCGRGRTSINIKDKCTDAVIVVKGGALVCTSEGDSIFSTSGNCINQAFDLGKVFGAGAHTIHVKLEMPTSYIGPQEWILNLGQESTDAFQWIWHGATAQVGTWGRQSQIDQVDIRDCTDLTTTFDGSSKLTMYCNGEFLTQEDNVNFNIASSILAVGGINGEPNFDFKGCVKYVEVWDYAMRSKGVKSIPPNYGYSFTIRGRLGSEAVTINDGGNTLSFTASTIATTYTAYNSYITVEFSNDNGPRDVFFATEYPVDIRSDSRWPGWNCDFGVENHRCNLVREGTFAWGSVYQISFSGNPSIFSRSGSCINKAFDLGKVFGTGAHTIHVKLEMPTPYVAPRQWILNLGQESTDAFQWIWHGATAQIGTWSGQNQIKQVDIRDCTDLTTTFDGRGKLLLYCNGQFLAGQLDVNFNIASSILAVGGIDREPNGDFKGCVKYVEVWDYELSSTEVNSIIPKYGDSYKEYGEVNEILSVQDGCNANTMTHEECRRKSEAIFVEPTDSDESEFNGLLWSFGQFVDHDLDLVKEVSSLVVNVPFTPDDSKSVEFEFHRAESECPVSGQHGNRKNSISARIDLSQVYGSTLKQEDMLRDTSDRAKIKIGSNDMLQPHDSDIFCCGDARCAENPFLTAQHVLWLKHHNVIVDELRDETNLQGEDLYQEAKRLNIATYQRIVDKEFLPALVGPTPSAKNWGSDDWIAKIYENSKINIGSLHLNANEGGVTAELCRDMVLSVHDCKKRFFSHGVFGECICATVDGSNFLTSTPGRYTTYEMNRIESTYGDMSISSLFANAAYRLHHLVNDELDFDITVGGVTRRSVLSDHFHSSQSYAERGALDGWLTRLLQQRSHKFGNHMAKSLQHMLFTSADKLCDESTNQDCRDLAALNCLRGIDVGLPKYNDVRRMFDLPPEEDFDWSVDACGDNLEQRYNGDIERVELFMGGSCEKPVPGAVLGETFLVIVKDQFLRLRDNDPDWIAYQSPGHTYKDVIRRSTNIAANLFHDHSSFLHKDSLVPVPSQKPTQPDFTLNIRGLQGERRSSRLFKHQILDQDTFTTF